MRWRFGAALAISVALGSAVIAHAASAGLRQWGAQVKTRHGGTTLVVSGIPHPSTEAFQAMTPDFTELTGIKVEWGLIETGRIQSKQFLEHTAKTGRHDVNMYKGASVVEYMAKGVLQPLSPFLQGGHTPKGYEYEDLLPAARETLGTAGGAILVEFGVLNAVLGALFGLKVNWLSDANALYAAAAVGVWMAAPFVALFFLAGLQSLPRAPFEAARVDGASWWQIFRHLTLPMLRPTVLVVTLFTVIDALRSFGAIYLLTEGGPGVATLVLPLYMYRTGFGYSSILGKGSAIAFVLILLTMALAGILVRVMRQPRGA